MGEPGILFSMVIRLPVKMPDNSDFLTVNTRISEADVKKFADAKPETRSEWIEQNTLVLTSSAANFLREKFDFETFRRLAGINYYEGTLSCKAWLAVAGKWENADNTPAPMGEISFELPATLVGPESNNLFKKCVFGCLRNLSGAIIRNFELITKIINADKFPAV